MHLARRALARPVFLVGCGRSGTTILGETLARHGELHYLNEPRDLWAAAYPQTDVWSARAAARRGRLALGRDDATWWRTQRLRFGLARRVRAAGRRRLLEKLPINAFRVPFLRTLFPDALLIHLLRNGIEVARSIERECERGPWYGADDYKWRLLAQHAARLPGGSALAASCATPYQRGLLEWRLAVESARAATASMSPAHCLEVRYEDLLDHPVDTLVGLQSFMDLEPDSTVASHARTHIARRSPTARELAIPSATGRIAGTLLDELGYARS